MKIILTIVLIMFAQITSAQIQNAPDVIKNSEEIATINVTTEDQAVLNVCHQYPLELNFFDEKGMPAQVLQMRLERILHQSVKITQDHPQSPFVLQTAISKDAFMKSLEANLDLSESLRVVKVSNETLLMKVNLINCLPHSPRVKVVNIKHLREQSPSVEKISQMGNKEKTIFLDEDSKVTEQLMKKNQE